MDNKDRYIPNEGVTPAEKYLQDICKRTFLSLWSYPGLFKSPGDELCDLLVVFENDVIIFSDKYCHFPDSGNLKQDWNRWYKKAIIKSARQAWGAERWIKNYPNKIYNDKHATIKFPFEIPNISTANFHLVVVAHDGARRCAQEMGGSGSFMIKSGPKLENYNRPFTIGDIDTKKTFVHILDDTTLNVLLGKLDTITDFVSYLKKKEKLMRSSLNVFAAGEEELLAYYLTKADESGIHDFIFSEKISLAAFEEGLWLEFVNSDVAKRQMESDSISYAWDELIEKSNFHAMQGTSYKTTNPPLQTTERILRLMAKEPRVKRRMLTKALVDLLEKTPSDKQAVRYIGSRQPLLGETTYVFLLYPKRKGVTVDEYREERRLILSTYCKITKIRFPLAMDIVGIATEPGKQSNSRSEDFVYLDASVWTPEIEQDTQNLFQELNMQRDLPHVHYHEVEYPDKVVFDPKELTVKLPKNPWNKPCPCKSGLKYKRCHGIGKR